MAAMTIETLTAMAEQIKRLPGVQSVNLWTRVPGRERLYIELTKRNGGQHWHGGCGLKCHIAAADGLLTHGDDWAGAATRKHHSELGTLDAIRAIRDTFRNATASAAA